MEQLNLKVIREYFETQPVLKAWLFGSYARGEQKTTSDIDLLIEFDDKEKISLLTYAGIKVGLEELLKKEVDLVENGTLYPGIVPFVEADKILIYERTA